MKKRQMIGMGLITTILVCSGCQKSPENSIVKNKNLDNMIEQAQNEENGVSNVEDMTEYDTYQDSFSDEELGVTVTVDARVDIPKADQMSIVRIRQKEISQEFFDQVKEAVVPGVTLYDASMLDTPTKGSIEEEIRSAKMYIEEVEAEFAAGDIGEESLEIYKKECQEDIDRLQKEYEAAPLKVDLTKYPLDGQIHKVADLISQDPDNEYYIWQQELNPNGSIYYGAGEGEDGLYHMLYVQNNEDRGTCLRYENRNNEYPNIRGILATSPLGYGYAKGELWKASGDVRVNIETGWNEAQEVEEESTHLTQEEAQRKADDFINSLNLNEYSLYEGDLYCQYLRIEDEILKYRKLHAFMYLHTIDGVFVNNGSSKMSEGWQGDQYVKKEWPGESIVVYVNDSGIAGFHYLAPIETVETVVEKAGMKSFDEIKDIFKQMIIVTNASEYASRTIQIDRIALRYTRISEADSFDTGLLVPVWDFEGTISNVFGDKDNPYTGSILTINAIDGSVINKELGY